jgi:hypothetical protein
MSKKEKKKNKTKQNKKAIDEGIDGRTIKHMKLNNLPLLSFLVHFLSASYLVFNL